MLEDRDVFFVLSTPCELSFVACMFHRFYVYVLARDILRRQLCEGSPFVTSKIMRLCSMIILLCLAFYLRAECAQEGGNKVATDDEVKCDASDDTAHVLIQRATKVGGSYMEEMHEEHSLADPPPPSPPPSLSRNK